jgi:hypothetical protein
MDGLTVDGDVNLTGLLALTGARGTFVDSSENSSIPHIFATNDAVGDFSQEAGHLVIQPRVHTSVYRDIIFAGGVTNAKRLMTIQGEGDISFYEDTGTTPKFFWDASAESLGIGTSSPSAKLTVAGGSDMGIRIISDADGYASLQFGDVDDFVRGGISYNSADDSLQLRGYNNTERMRIDSSGNVGIGTSSPSAPLTVNGTNAGIRFTDANQDTSNYYGEIYKDYNGNAPFVIQSKSNGGGVIALNPDGGNVGIGRTDPTQLLEVHKNSGGDQTVAKFSAHNYNDTGKTYIELGTEYGDGSSRIGSFNDTGNKSVLVFETHGASSGAFDERMRIDSSGNVLVGKTVTDTLGTAGHELHNSGMVHHTRATGTVQYLNRTGNDGTIADFRKDGTTVGSIGTEGGRLQIGKGASGLYFYDSGPNVLPWNIGSNATADNSIDLGSSGARFKDLYLSGVATMGGASYDSSKTLKVSTVGTTNTNYAFYGIGTQTGADGRLNYWDFTNTNNSSAYFVYAQASGSGNVFNIRGDGDVENLNNSYGAVSDQKLKENIQDASSQWDDLKAIQVKKYSLISDELNEPNQIGVIAQELEAAGMSGLVKNSPDINMETGEDLGTVTKTVKYSVLYMKALKALQEAMNRIETLETRIAALEE